MEYKLRKLENGLRVLVVPMKNTETVTVTAMIQTGASNENRSNNGVSHFLEHMFFKGTKKCPTPKIQNERLDKIGAMHNAFTSYDETVYYVKAHKKHVETAIHFFGDALQNSLLEKREIDRERGVIFEEMRMYNDHPQRKLWDDFTETMFGDQPTGRLILGSEKTLNQMNRKTLTEYWKKQYVPSNMILVVAGNIDIESTFKFADKYFKGLKKGTAKAQEKLKPLSKAPVVKVCDKKTDQAHMMFGFPTFPFGSNKEAAIRVLAVILAGSMSSRLWRKIREERGLAYTVSADNDSLKQSGVFTIYVGAPAKAAEKITKIIVKEIDSIIKKGVTAPELELAKEKIRGAQAMRLEATESVAFALGKRLLFKNRILTPEKIISEIDSITSKDIQKMAEKLCGKRKYYLTIIGDGLDESKLLDVIKNS